ncbi:MAG: HD domain-containing protein [Desulfurococcales archaeon]|nr:HD domain-containing protein [Desulfurococcales archaeon]
MERREILRSVEARARKIMGQDPAHGWPHIERVRRLAQMIVWEEELNVDKTLLELSVLLHDVGRFLPGEGHHAEKSATYAKHYLATLGIPSETIKRVVHAILAHSYSLGVKAETPEAMVLSDADKLDALGAIGIARAIHHGCQQNRDFEYSIGHMKEKLLKLPSLMYLESARRLANERVQIVKLYINQFEIEREFTGGLPLS